MIKINDKKDCCGCTACYNACPVNAIKMEADEEGFLYPIIDPNRCTNCGLCEKSCPIINHIPVVEKQRTSFVARAKNLDIVLNSTSGGFVTPLANWVLQQNGVVCGASFDENYNIIHKIIKSPASPIEFQGSKYVQSDLGECFSEIKKKLNDGTMVCFIGTPCQVYGLKTFL